ncbi:MAG TPA: tRNA lysidine(34) synthetase TilS [Bacteroidetes bacterium]|nr:tRNA lysidine(34) synthetase TilS [Bacteroidota bacterium]
MGELGKKAMLFAGDSLCFYIIWEKIARMMPDLKEKCIAFMNSERLVKASDSVLVAVSGGPDSMVLTEILRQYAGRVVLAHCNFGLRAASSAEEALVRAYSAQHGLELHVRQFDVAAEQQEGESTQMVARRVRYAFFEELSDHAQFDHIATAHHRDDQVETLLMSFFRGRQPRLLQGIPLQRGRYIRPLHFAYKAEIIAYATEQQIPFALDASNSETKYQRNSIRNELLPALEKLNPSFRTRLLEQFAEQELQFDFLETVFLSAKEKVVRSHTDGLLLDLAAFQQLWPGKFLPLFFSWMAHAEGYSGKEALAARKLLSAQTGARFTGRAGEMLRNRETIIFAKVGGSKVERWTPIKLEEELPQQLVVQVGNLEVTLLRLAWTLNSVLPPTAEMQVLDISRLHFPLTIRQSEVGDRMQPLGMKGRKLLSDIFIDEKYSSFAKRNAIVIADETDILFLSGFRIAEKGKVRPETREVLAIQIIDRNEST